MEREVLGCEDYWNDAIDQLNRMRLNGVFTDIVIETGDHKTIQAHRNILVMAFPTLEHDVSALKKGRLKWTRFNSDVIQAALDFAYTGTVELTMDNALRLFLFSFNLKCRKLISLCARFLTSNGRIHGENVSQIWAAANSVLHKKLMKACVQVIRLHLEHINRDQCFRKWSTPLGMSFILADCHSNTSVEQPHVSEDDFAVRCVSCWLDSKKTEGNTEINLQHLIERSHLNILPFETLLFIYSKAAELRIPQPCRDRVADALRKCRSLGYSAKAQPSTSVPSSTEPKIRKQFLAIGSCHWSKGTAELRNLPELQIGPEIKQTLPFKPDCTFVLFRNWVCSFGGVSADTIKATSTFTIFNLETNRVFQGPSMQQARCAFAAVTTSDCIFVFGGFDEKYLSACEVYESKFNRWVSLPDMPKARIYASAVFVPGEGAVVVGGSRQREGSNEWTSLNDVQLLRISSGGENHQKWNWLELPKMLQGRDSPGTAYYDGRIFVAGCYGNQHFDIESLKYPVGQNETPQWTFLSLLEFSYSYPVSLIELDGSLLLINGDGQVLQCHNRTNDNGSDEKAGGEIVWSPVFKLTNISKPIILTFESKI